MNSIASDRGYFCNNWWKTCSNARLGSFASVSNSSYRLYFVRSIPNFPFRFMAMFFHLVDDVNQKSFKDFLTFRMTLHSKYDIMSNTFWIFVCIHYINILFVIFFNYRSTNFSLFVLYKRKKKHLGQNLVKHNKKSFSKWMVLELLSLLLITFAFHGPAWTKKTIMVIFSW